MQAENSSSSRHCPELIRVALVIFCTISFGCVTSANKVVLEKYAGKSGFFSVFPTGITAVGHNSKFRICDQSKITKIEKRGSAKFVFLEQNSNHFGFHLDNPDENEIDFLQKHFIPTLSFPEKSINLKSGKVSIKKAICDGMVFTGMTIEQLLMVYGRPEKINRTVTAGYESSQWVYPKPGSTNQFEKNYFYFTNGVLRSWQD